MKFSGRQNYFAEASTVARGTDIVTARKRKLKNRLLIIFCHEI
jgi:hypothetical protein